MVSYICSPAGTADISDAAGTDQYLFEAPYAGKILVDHAYVRWSEATGTQSGAQGVLSLKVAGVEVGTLTANISDAIGQTQTFAVDGTNATASDPWYPFAAGDAILVEVTTQASGGTVTGDGEVYLPIQYNTGA